MTDLSPKALLQMAQNVIDERGMEYGQITDNFQLIADLSSLRLGRHIHPYEIAVIMACVKNARSFSTPDHLDSHIDGANYELFAATFAADYLKQKRDEGSVDISFKKKTELKIAAAEEIKPPRGLKPLPRTDVQEAIQNALGRLEE
jgi:hypothetical protein